MDQETYPDKNTRRLLTIEAVYDLITGDIVDNPTRSKLRGLASAIEADALTSTALDALHGALEASRRRHQLEQLAVITEAIGVSMGGV